MAGQGPAAAMGACVAATAGGCAAVLVAGAEGFTAGAEAGSLVGAVVSASVGVAAEGGAVIAGTMGIAGLGAAAVAKGTETAAAAKAATRSGARAADAAAEGTAAAGAARAGQRAETAAPRSGAARCDHSFLPATKVLMADGHEKQIEDVKQGDKVLATDPETGESQSRTVEKLITTKHDKDFATITIRDAASGKSSKIVATVTHPFWVESKHAWVEAGDLKADMPLHEASGAVAPITSVKIWHRPHLTQDLTVAITHTYYVPAGVTPILVHNCNGGIAPNGAACSCNGSTNPSNADLVQAIATRAQDRLGGSGAVSGTAKHAYADTLPTRYQGIYGSRGLITEQSYLGGVPVPRGTAGSARPDVFDPAAGIVYDYKFVRSPGRGIGKGQADNNALNVPGVSLTVEVNP